MTRLDHLLRIGDEHGVAALTGRGFGEETSDVGLDPVVQVAEPQP